MADAAELTKEEQELFDQMAKDEGAPEDKPAEAAAEAVKKADDDKGAKDAAEKAAIDAKAKEQKTVPAEALKEARSENKDLRKELDQLKTTLADGNKNLQKLMESMAKKAEEQPGPKFEDDPAGALKHENDQLKKQITDINAKLAKQDEAGENSNKMQQFATFVSAREKDFAKTEPAYYKAADYVAEVWRDEFREAGFKEEELAQAVFGKSLAVTNKATQAGKDPATAIWNIAKRYGFKPEAPKDEVKDEKKPDGESKLEQIKRGVETAKSAGGGTGPDDLSLSSLAQMTDDQIDKLVQDKDWWAKQMRGSRLH